MHPLVALAILTIVVGLLVVVFVFGGLMMLAVPEFSYPTPWAFLGLSLMLSSSAPEGHRQGAERMDRGQPAADG